MFEVNWGKKYMGGKEGYQDVVHCYNICKYKCVSK